MTKFNEKLLLKTFRSREGLEITLNCVGFIGGVTFVNNNLNAIDHPLLTEDEITEIARLTGLTDFLTNQYEKKIGIFLSFEKPIELRKAKIEAFLETVKNFIEAVDKTACEKREQLDLLVSFVREEASKINLKVN